jgi:AcrR family transcriptional regulator
MARTRDPEAHALRRDAFVDAAQRLIQSKGYEQMSVQDVLDELGSSRGALYHYFDSKTALLEAVVERMVDVVTEALEPIVANPSLPAARKLQRVFAGISDWKMDRRELLEGFMTVWLSDENVLVRERFRRHVTARLTPLLARILRQGKAEGAFSIGSPDDTAAIIVSLVVGGNEMASQLYVARRAGSVSFEEVERRIAALGEAFERLVGLPSGSWPVPDPEVIRYWFA